jgi:hypothetical protein
LRRLDFVIRAGSFNFSIGDISKFILHRQDQQTSRLPTAAAKSLQQIRAGSVIIIVRKIIDQLDRRRSRFVTALRASKNRKSGSRRKAQFSWEDIKQHPPKN